MKFMKINSLSGLMLALDNCDASSVSNYFDIMNIASISEEDLSEYLAWNRDPYTRNMLKKN